MKTILGLDLGTNSIGWALVKQDFENKQGEISGMGSRIIPMSQDILGEFDKGNSVSQTSARTGYRGVRRLHERNLLRRERLHRVLNILGFLPKHYADAIDFSHRLGQFKENREPKLPYCESEKGKYEFIFQTSFNEMVADFRKNQPQLFYTKPNGEETKIPYDWTIYYLRKKALSEKLEKEELAWILLNFNQKRGYYQLRGEEEEENQNKLVEFHALKVVEVVADDAQKGKDDVWYSVVLENGWVYRRSSKTPLSDWTGKIKEFIVTTDLNDDKTVKTDKEGKEKRSFKAVDSEQDWIAIKKSTEEKIEKSGETVGSYIYDTLLQKPDQKIRGKLVRTIERKFYKEELLAILKKQTELQPELFTDELYNDCIRELYRQNESQQFVLSSKDFVHLFVEDIIFYQRPLKSKKSLIGDCKLEYRIYKDKDGNQIKEYLKTIPKSNPLYQEFRVWQWLSNLKIYRKNNDTDVTAQFIRNEDERVELFDYLMLQKEVNHKDILKYLLHPVLKAQYLSAKASAFNKELENEIAKYRWNYVFDNSKEKEEDKSKKYPCNTTGYDIKRRLEKVKDVPAEFLTPKIEMDLWHIIYSVTDKKEFETALKSFANKHKLDEVTFVDNFKKFPPFKSEYGSFSEKAIKKLLPLMRSGKYWNWEAIDTKTQDRIGKIISGEYDEEIKNRVREKAINLTDTSHFQGLPLWLASYVVYDRHSETNTADKWDTIAKLENYLDDFKQHSLRNPIVEQVITETLRVVRDIWKQYGQGANCFFDEIHVELGREMKNTAEDRKWLTQQNTDNEATNLRIRELLIELKQNTDKKLFVENVHPNSPIQQDILKIYEEYALQNTEKYTGKDENGFDQFIYEPIDEDIIKISKKSQPTKAELQRYKLWLEQRYRSPYTGQVIPLSRLFTEDYQIEHIIPKSRYFDDSFNNKVICEEAVNQLKDKQLGLEFIKNHYGEEVELGLKKTAKIFTEDEYRDFVEKHYAKSGTKRRNLLLEDIPEKMIERQMNDTRYISKFVCSLLSNIVRADREDDGINSKNLIPTNGKITSTLKKDWGLNDVWNNLILPRFERLNKLKNTTEYTYWNEQHQKFLPIEYSPVDTKKIEKKRIDHRHHSMDALIIACTTRDHVNLLNNQSAKSENSRYDLQNKLRNKEKRTWLNKKENRSVERDIFTEFKKPWATFTQDTRNELDTVIVSFKQNLRVINKTVNRYQHYVNGKKAIDTQKRGDNWAIRKPLHKETVYGKVQLDRVKVPKDKILTASRKALDTSFNLKAIEAITDTGIQKILINYLKSKEGNMELAFSPEGIEDMNKNIALYNDGMSHKPIYKVRVFELGSRFALGETGNKTAKFVEAAKGTNLCFAIYADESGKRSYETIPLNVVIERLKQGQPSCPTENEKGHQLLFDLSPNDLVYVPTIEEQENPQSVDFNNLNKEQVKRVYKFVSCTRGEGYFIPNVNASEIVKNENGTNSKNERMQNFFDDNTIFDESGNLIQIKAVCWKLEVNRLGQISKVINEGGVIKNIKLPQYTLHEPTAIYHTKKMQFFDNLAEMNEADAKEMAKLTPEQHLSNATRLNESIYKDKLDNSMDKKLKFRE